MGISMMKNEEINMFMELTAEGKEILSNLIDTKMRMMLDWTDFVEDAGVPIYLLEKYINCEESDISEEHFKGIACALGISDQELFNKLEWEIPEHKAFAEETNDTSEETQNADLSGEIALLEDRCNKAISEEKMFDFSDPYNALWDIFDENTDEALRKELATKISDFTYRSGECYNSQNNFLKLCGSYNAAYSFTTDNPEYPEGAIACVKLAVGVFEKKFTFREFENVESYIDELVPLAKRFPENEEFTVHSAVCLCNLLQLCPYDYGVFFSRLMEIVDCLTELSLRFPQNHELQLCSLRSLVFFLCYGKPRLREEIYEEYFELTQNAFDDNSNIISKFEFDDMNNALIENDISL